MIDVGAGAEIQLGVSKEKLKELVKTTTKAGKPCEKYTGEFSVNGNVITI